MVLDVMRDISGQVFTEINQLAPTRPVFMLKTENGNCVLKAEKTSSMRIVEMPMEVMQIVDRHAKSRAVTRSELLKLKGWAAANKDKVHMSPAAGADYFAGQLGIALIPPMPGRGNMNQLTFTIMEMKQQLVDTQTGFEAMMNGDKTIVRRIAETLSAKGGLEKLGSIIAADAFSNNGDRVALDGLGGSKIPGTQISTKVLINTGNIFVGNENGKPTLLGLDNYDPGTLQKDFNAPLHPGQPYLGEILNPKNKANRTKVCLDLVDDLETLLGPRNRAFSFLQQTRLPSNAAARIEKGIDEGALKILMYFKQKFARGGIPIGMVERFQRIGWWNNSNFPNK